MKYDYSVCNPRSAVSSMSAGGCNLLLSASWEDRSQDILQRIDLEAFNKVIVIRFKNPGSDQTSAKFFKNVKSECRKKKVAFAKLDFDSIRSDRGYQHEKAAELFVNLTAGARNWLVDLTCIPRALVAPLAMLADRTNTVRTMMFHYSHPRYTVTRDIFDEFVFKFTDGQWNISEPAFCEVSWNAGLSGANIISTGFEYESLKNIIYQRVQDTNHFLVTNPGVSDDYTQKAEEIAQRISRAFEVKNDHFWRVGHCDFVGTKAMLTSLIDRLEKDHGYVSLISAGGKIHGLAMCYAKIERPKSSLKIRMPVRYVENSTRGNGQFECIKIENTIAPL